MTDETWFASQRVILLRIGTEPHLYWQVIVPNQPYNSERAGVQNTNVGQLVGEDYSLMLLG